MLNVNNSKRVCCSAQCYIQGELIKRVDHTKYLVVTSNHWNDHVNQICSKTNVVIAFLRETFCIVPRLSSLYIMSLLINKFKEELLDLYVMILGDTQV